MMATKIREVLREYGPVALVGLTVAVAVALVVLLAGGSIGQAAGAAQVTGIASTAVGARRKKTQRQVDRARERVEDALSDDEPDRDRPLERKARDADQWL